MCRNYEAVYTITFDNFIIFLVEDFTHESSMSIIPWKFLVPGGRYQTRSAYEHNTYTQISCRILGVSNDIAVIMNDLIILHVEY